MSASRRIDHLDFFGVTANEDNGWPRLCEEEGRELIPQVDGKKIKAINSGKALAINNNVKVTDWMGEHNSNRHHNTELIEEKLEDLKTKKLLYRSVTKNKMEVITRASVLAKLALPYFGMDPNSGSYFTYANKTLRFIGSSIPVNGIPLPKLEEMGLEKKKERVVDEWFKRGHLSAAMITNGHDGKGPLVFGKDLVYTLNQLQFKKIRIIVSKEVDGQIVGDIKEALNHADDEAPVVVEIKTSSKHSTMQMFSRQSSLRSKLQNKETYGKPKWLNTIIKDVALGNIDHLVNLFIPENAIKKVGIANLRDEEVVKLVEKEFYYIIEKVLEEVYSKLSNMDNVKGHVRTEYYIHEGFVIHWNIYDGASDYEYKKLPLDMYKKDDVLQQIKGFEPTYIYYSEGGLSYWVGI